MRGTPQVQSRDWPPGPGGLDRAASGVLDGEEGQGGALCGTSKSRLEYGVRY